MELGRYFGGKNNIQAREFGGLGHGGSSKVSEK